ncbi:hypothetical protein F2Q69_00015996 [Brassica cretica]|uniref:Secreted protein n=1 Tax=Brassica cretica TaxID=69181 RepID=A0A8S9QRU2_BRACR|nr:hypothetical protein F2Q69_00015996 [Brassica cretica]
MTLRLLLGLPSGVASSSWWSAGFWFRSTSASSMFRRLLVPRLTFPCGVDDGFLSSFSRVSPGLSDLYFFMLPLFKSIRCSLS